MVIASIHFTFDSKDGDKVESMFRELREASLKEPGVIEFQVGRSEENPNVFALWEVYRDKDAVDAHRATEHFQRLVANGVRPLAQNRSVETVIPI
jgi:quinol monooxygenase YgiN